MPDPHSFPFPEPTHAVNPELQPHYSIESAKRWATEEYGQYSQKEHLAHITLDGIDTALKTLAGLGIRARLVPDDSETTIDKFPLMVHKGETFMVVANEEELEKALSDGWVDKTALPVEATGTDHEVNELPHEKGEPISAPVDEHHELNQLSTITIEDPSPDPGPAPGNLPG